jgi:choline kinase
MNEEYTRGPLLSLKLGLQGASDEEDLIIMDADVLYPKALLARLVDSVHLPCVLLDTASKQTGEEMMVGVRAGKARCFVRTIDPESWDLVGETVGFLKVGAADVATLRTAVRDALLAGGKDQEYERAYDRLLASSPFGYELVGELPWMEIDFAADIVRASLEILPRIEGLEARAHDKVSTWATTA